MSDSNDKNQSLDSDRKKTLKRVHWKQIHGKLRGDKFAVRAIPQMLVEGYTMNRGVFIGDKVNGGWKEVFLEVEYDREYVILWLVEKIIKPFSQCSFQTVQKLIGDAYRLHKELKEQAKKDMIHDCEDIL